VNREAEKASSDEIDYINLRSLKTDLAGVSLFHAAERLQVEMQSEQNNAARRLIEDAHALCLVAGRLYVNAQLIKRKGGGKMLKRDIKTIEQAMAYQTDCQLATVVEFAVRKTKAKRDYRRQINIAQSMIEWCVKFGVDVSTTRADVVIDCYDGNVSAWAAEAGEK